METETDSRAIAESSRETGSITPAKNRRLEMDRLLEDPLCAFLYEQASKQSYLRKMKEVFGSKQTKERSKSLLKPYKFLTNRIF